MYTTFIEQCIYIHYTQYYMYTYTHEVYTHNTHTCDILLCTCNMLHVMYTILCGITRLLQTPIIQCFFVVAIQRLV